MEVVGAGQEVGHPGQDQRHRRPAAAAASGCAPRRPPTRRRPRAGRRRTSAAGRCRPGSRRRRPPAAAAAAGPARRARTRASGPRTRAGPPARTARAARRPTAAAAPATRSAARRPPSGHAAIIAPSTAAAPTSRRKTTARPASAPAPSGLRRARRIEPRPSAIGGRVRARHARPGHRARDREPGPERQRLRGVAPRQDVGQHADRRVEQDPQHPPAHERGAEDEVQPGVQDVLPRPVVRVEVAVGQLPVVGDPCGRLQDQPLVVGVDAPPDRAGGQRRPEQEQHEAAQPRDAVAPCQRDRRARRRGRERALRPRSGPVAARTTALARAGARLPRRSVGGRRGHRGQHHGEADALGRVRVADLQDVQAEVLARARGSSPPSTRSSAGPRPR